MSSEKGTSHKQMPPFTFCTTMLMASLSKWNNRPFSGRRKNSSTLFAALPMHQHINIVNFIPVRLLTFIKRVTSSVFTNVTIGTGDDIHILNASARILSWGLTSCFICLYQLLAVSDCKDTDSFVYDQISGIICTQFVINDIKTTRFILWNGEKNVFLQ